MEAASKPERNDLREAYAVWVKSKSLLLANIQLTLRGPLVARFTIEQSTLSRIHERPQGCP